MPWGRKKGLFWLAVLIVLVVAVAISGCGQKSSPESEEPAYPQRGIDLVVPYAPGSSIDTAARLVAAYASRKWGQPVNVVNMPGGSGVPGVLEVMEAAPDGYKLLMDGHVSTSMLKAAQANLPFKIEERTYLGRIVTVPVFFAVRADAPWKNLKEVVEYARNNPKSFKWGAGTLGSINNFSQTQLFESAGVDPNKGRVIFEQGNAQAIAALLGGQVQFGIATLPDMMNLGKAGKIRALAVTTPERLASFPDVPTTKEAGFPGANIVGWYGVSGPPGLGENVVRAWTTLLEQAAQDSTFLEEAAKVGHVIQYVPPDKLKAQIEQEYKTYLDIAVKTGLRKQ